MNKQSNTYSIIYIIALVVIVGVGLAVTAISLKEKQQANTDADKMRQILLSVHITPGQNIKDDFNKYITEQLVVNTSGEVVSDEAFNVNIATEVKKNDNERLLPVYVCQLSGKEKKYILPLYGAGLWGPIWGYVSFNSDGNTIYGAYFAHQGETPGLGAEIDQPEFSNRFVDKVVFKNDNFYPIAIVKNGQKPINDADYVDGISGGTITSKGVESMLSNCLTPYQSFLKQLKSK